MVENYKKYIEETSSKTGFIKSTLEKVERLLNILEWINNHEKLSKLLALKGGTAINTAVFNFPRLSVDIDLDLAENLTKDEMIKERENIHNLLVKYLNSNDYRSNIEKSKNVYALDSIVAEYEDIRGNIDNIKITEGVTHQKLFCQTSAPQDPAEHQCRKYQCHTRIGCKNAQKS